MHARRLPRFRFSLKSVFVLFLGIAIGYALNLRTLQLLTGVPASEAYMSSLPIYRVEPPDILRVKVFGESPQTSPLISGQHLVLPDGTITLEKYGTVAVAGRTIDEVKDAITLALSQHIRSPRVVVEVASLNSKVYYVITKGSGSGDNVFRFPITGSETALDAIAQVGGVGADSTDVWISRPPRNGVGSPKILSVEWDKVASGESTVTNYQMMPSDRLVISRKRPVTAPK